MNRKISISILTLVLLGFFAAGFISIGSDPHGSKGIVTQQEQLQNSVEPVYDTPVYTDNFDGANDTNSLKARGYKVWYRGTGLQGLTATWFQGDATVFPAFNGPTTGYVAANYNVVTGANNIDSWLVLPRISGGLLAGDSLYFYSRGPTGSTWPDSIRVMYSAGDSVPEGTWTELGRFKTNLTTWERRGFRAPTSSVNGRFAVRYCVADGGPSGNNSDYIGIDAMVIERSATPPSAVNRAMFLPTPGVNTNFVLIPYNSGMVGFQNITIEAWVKIGGTTTANTVLNKGAASFDYQLGINATTAMPFFRAQGIIVSGTGITIPVGQWTHVAVTYDGTTVKFYKNGVMSFSTASVNPLGSSTGEMRIGRGNADAGSGGIDEVRLWSIARTDQQIAADMCNKWIANSTTGLKAKWHMDSTFTDSVSSFNGSGQGTVTFDTATVCTPVGIKQTETQIPQTFILGQNYPNPFNPNTKINFSIPKDGYVEIDIYDVTGRKVTTLVSDPFRAGTYSVDFNAGKLASGVYFYTLTSGDFTATKKMLLIK
jgi:hypothetical protein